MAILSIGELLGMGPSELSGLVPYSGLEYDASGYISGISGSAIGGAGGGGGGIDSATCSAIASSYAESAASGKVDTTAFDDCCSSVNSALSGISAAVSAVTGQTGNYLPASASSDFAPASSLTGKLDNSASSTWYPREGNPSGFLTAHQSLAGYATQGYVDSSVSSRAYASALTGKLDNSASSTWYPITGNPSGFLTAHQSLSAYVPKSSISAQSSVWNTVTGRQYASAMTGYVPTSESSKYQPKSSISAWTGQMQFISAKADNSAISSWSSNFVYKSAVSSWSSQIATLSSTVSSLSATLSAITANKYTLSAGAGISVTNDTSTKTTIIATV